MLFWQQHETPDCWATHSGAELDLLLFKDGRRYGIECKRVDAPSLTPSMRHALTDLELDRLIVVCPGGKGYSLADKITVMPLTALATNPTITLLNPESCLSTPTLTRH